MPHNLPGNLFLELLVPTVAFRGSLPAVRSPVLAVAAYFVQG